MKKIAVINDLSGMGKCSLTAALPVISAIGVQCCPFPTAVLSNQTGYESCFYDDFTDKMSAYAAEWKKRGFRPDGIYTGFMGNQHQIDVVEHFLTDFADEQTMILVDPVMGDSGKTYGIYTDAFLARMKRLVRRAHIITPNLTEAMLLAGGREHMEKWLGRLPEDSGQDLIRIAQETAETLIRQYEIPTVVITGVTADWKVGNLIQTASGSEWVFSDRFGGSYSGTGDLFASVLAAGVVKGFDPVFCVKAAVRFLGPAIRDAAEEKTDRNDGVCFEKYLYHLGGDFQ